MDNESWYPKQLVKLVRHLTIRRSSSTLPIQNQIRPIIYSLGRWLENKFQNNRRRIILTELTPILFLPLITIVKIFVLPIWMFKKGKPLGAAGALILLIIFVVAWIGPLLVEILPPEFPDGKTEYAHAFLNDTLQAPGQTYLLGTDSNGRDILTRIIFGTEITVLIGLGTVLITAIFSTIIGTVSAYFGGLIDLFIQRIVDIWIAFPPLFLLITVLAVFGSGGDGFLGIGRGPAIGPQAAPGDRWIWEAFPRTTVTIVTLSLILSGPTSRVIRGSVLAVMNQEYIEAARSLGGSHLRLMRVHILPNIMPIVLVLASINLGIAVLAEATLSFLGLGIPAPFPTWGQMLSGLARLIGPSSWWVAIFPGLAIFLAVYGFNMIGDAMRDLLDPRLRGSEYIPNHHSK